MKYVLLLFVVISGLHAATAQERLLVSGLVKNEDSLLSNVHVRNISSGKFSVTDQQGTFQLNLAKGDTLLLTHVGMEDYISYIKEEDLHRSPLLFQMQESSQELREVIVDETSEINAVSLGIIPKKIEKLSVNERRLRTAGDFKPQQLLGIIGGGVSLDAILNAINGRTKKLKRNVAIEGKQRHRIYLELNYMDYMQRQMKLTDHQIRLLINHVVEDQELAAAIDSENEAWIQFFLQDRWIQFQERLETSE